MNQVLVKIEEIDINFFLVCYENWYVIEIGIGLWFILMKKGDGLLVQLDQEVKVQYCIFLFDGMVVYQIKEDEVDVFMIDKSLVELGIQEGIKMMYMGDCVKLIMLSYFVDGFLGDMGKILFFLLFVVDVELVEIK